MSVGMDGLLKVVPDNRSKGRNPETGLYDSPTRTDLPLGLGPIVPQSVLRDRLIRRSLEPRPLLGPGMLRAAQKYVLLVLSL